MRRIAEARVSHVQSLAMAELARDVLSAWVLTSEVYKWY